MQAKRFGSPYSLQRCGANIHAAFLCDARGAVAQLAEQQPFKLWVQGSIPCRLTFRQANDPSLARGNSRERNFPTPRATRKRRARLPHETASEGTRRAIGARRQLQQKARPPTPVGAERTGGVKAHQRQRQRRRLGECPTGSKAGGIALRKQNDSRRSDNAREDGSSSRT